MKSKIFFTTMFLFLQVQSLFSQCISVELSITWEMGFNLFKKDSVMSIPILNITYRNYCNTNYYFFKASTNDRVWMGCGFHSNHYGTTEAKRALSSCGSGTGEKFNVIMGGEPWYRTGWTAFNDTVDYTNSHFQFVNCSLNNIYEYFYPPKDYSKYEKLLPFYFIPSNVTIENILGFYNDQFVFLKPEETHIDTYNLIGFKLVEGCYTFLIAQDEIKDYVAGINPDAPGGLEIPLPSVVGEYQLYSGGFNTNKVTVCFGEK